MNREKKIALIIVYFGKLPSYFDFFLASAKQNTDVDFFIVTDQHLFIQHDNIHVIETSFQKMRLRIQGLFEFQISLDTPYKLVDFKPVYGLLFQKMISGFEYWGYCDIDQVFGNIVDFLPDNYQTFDKLFRLGHFTLFKNTADINSVFKLPVGMNYQKALGEPTIAVFDEIDGIEQKFQLLGRPVYNKDIFADILWSRWRFQRTYRGEDLTHLNNHNSIYLWDRGRLKQIIVSNQRVVDIPLMYIHFQKRNLEGEKELARMETPFIITNTGFIEFKESDCNLMELIQKFDCDSVFKEIQQRLKYNMYLSRRYIRKHIIKF